MKALRFLRLWPIIAFLILAAYQMAGAVPAITVSPASGPPTTGITAQGSGFGAYEAMDVYFDTSHLVLTVTSETGAFSRTLKAPRSAIPGVHWVTAVGRKSRSAAQKPFTVRTNWTMFRYGPKHQGFNPYENVLSPSNVAGLNEAWQYRTGAGDLVSSPAIANGVFYVGSYDGKLYALDANTGAFKWSYSTGNFVESSPAIANGVVYVQSCDCTLYALNASTGALLWSSTTGESNCSSPAVADGKVYVGSYDYALHAYSLDPAGVYGTIIRRPDPAELIPDFRLTPQLGKRGAVRSSEEVE